MKEEVDDELNIQPNKRNNNHWFCKGLQEFYEIIRDKNFIKWMYRPRDPSSLAIARIFFGFLMMMDIPEERGGAELDIRWGETRDCHFPLFSQLSPMSLPEMGLLYGIMWMGALGITIGYKFKFSCLLFSIPYWYIFLLDKSYWNNHSYLYGLLSIQFFFSSANNWCSIDALLDKSKNNKPVPYWNYFLIKFQIFLLYFYAGLKKTDLEWLGGHSMVNLSQHWVFDPFKLFFSTKQIDLFVVHWIGFFLDLTIGFWLLHKKTRLYAMFFCSSFHLMNSRLFSIGMFPYIGLATLPLFCEANWPKLLIRKFRNADPAQLNEGECHCQDAQGKENATFNGKTSETNSEVTWKKKSVVALILSYCCLQGFLPYSHFITKGYNNWTNGLYGYSWDMMVHSWDTILVVVKVVDNQSGREHFLDPQAWVHNQRWSKHADMCVQYAHCLKNNILDDYHREKASKSRKRDSITQFITSDDISVYIDVWCSLNGRFQQRMFDPKYDLLKANWSPFKPVEWLLPLLTEYNNLRNVIASIQEDVYSWSNYSDVLFIADFPGLYLENYISGELINVTLTVLEGEVLYEVEDGTSSVQLSKGKSIEIQTEVFHKIHTISSIPSCYMYTYINSTSESLKDVSRNTPNGRPFHSPFPLLEDTMHTVNGLYKMFQHITNSVMHVVYNVPMVRRSRIL